MSLHRCMFVRVRGSEGTDPRGRPWWGRGRGQGTGTGDGCSPVDTQQLPQNREHLLQTPPAPQLGGRGGCPLPPHLGGTLTAADRRSAGHEGHRPGDGTQRTSPQRLRNRSRFLGHGGSGPLSPFKRARGHLRDGVHAAFNTVAAEAQASCQAAA